MRRQRGPDDHDHTPIGPEPSAGSAGKGRALPGTTRGLAAVQMKRGGAQRGLSPEALERAQNLNPRYQERLGFDSSLFGTAMVDSASFARIVGDIQQRHGLVVDGILGPNTWAKLEPKIRMRDQAKELERRQTGLFAGAGARYRQSPDRGRRSNELEPGVLGPEDELESGVLRPEDELESGVLGPEDELESGVLGPEDDLESGVLGPEDMAAMRANQQKPSRSRTRQVGDDIINRRMDDTRAEDPWMTGGRATIDEDEHIAANTLESGVLDTSGDPIFQAGNNESASNGVQRRADGPSDVPNEDIGRIAQDGVRGAGQPLPHLDKIQKSFGPHDVTGVRAHVGGSAAEASDAIGAEAYATGNDVAFRGQPDLHTAAHEAAHVVQQRAGVQLKGGVGREGDHYEQHADRVADAVVSGDSAKPLLDGFAGAGGGDVILKKEASDNQTLSAMGPAVFRSAADILQNGLSRTINSAPPGYQHILWLLFWAKTGRMEDKQIEPEERATYLDSVEAILNSMRHTVGADWVAENVDPHLEELRHDIGFHVEMRRVRKAVRVDEDEVVEPDKLDDEGKRQLLLRLARTQLETVERLLKQADAAGGEDALAQAAGKVNVASGSLTDKALSKAKKQLLSLTGTLALSEDELFARLEDPDSITQGVASYAELTKSVTKISQRTLQVTAGAAWAIAKIGKNEAMAASAKGILQGTGKALGPVLSGADVVYGIATILDDDATVEEKEKGAKRLITGGTTLAAHVAGGSALVATAVGYAVYYELKFLARMYGQVRFGYAGMMHHAFRTLQGHAGRIASAGEELAKAGIMLSDEQDPEKRSDLERVERVLAGRLQATVNSCLSDCVPHSPATNTTRIPGAWKGLSDAFAPLQDLRVDSAEFTTGQRPGVEAASAANEVLKKIAWCLGNADTLIAESAGQDVDLDTDPDEEQPGES